MNAFHDCNFLIDTNIGTDYKITIQLYPVDLLFTCQKEDRSLFMISYIVFSTKTHIQKQAVNTNFSAKVRYENDEVL